MIYHGITKLLYLQVRDTLVEQIESGKLSPGDTLPGERILADTFDVSRVTIRKCISNMVEEGYIIRHRGKGSVVASRKLNYRLGPLLGIVEEFSETNSILEIKVLNKCYQKITTDVRNHLELEDDSEIYSFSRLILKDKKPLVLNYSYVSHDIGKMIELLDLESDKVYQYLENCGYNVSYAEQVIIAGICNKKEAILLDYKVGQPIIIAKRSTFLENGLPILYEKSIYRGDEYQYSIKLLRKQRQEINKL